MNALHEQFIAEARELIHQATDDLIVKYDQSHLLRLPRPAAEIIIGNPAIADISVQFGNLLVITGKTFGITNIIAEVPLAETFGYATDIRSMSQGQGTFTMELASYKKVPASVQEDIIADKKKQLVGAR